ncbi:MAG TPA: hypothetical protein V6C88_20145 [Chroococcidiopsis sp.]
MSHSCNRSTHRPVLSAALLSMALSVLIPASLSPAKADVVIYSNGSGSGITITTDSDRDRYYSYPGNIYPGNIYPNNIYPNNSYPTTRYSYPGFGSGTVIINPDYYGSDRNGPTRIRDSTLVSPVLIDSTVRDSTLINPVLIDSTIRNSTIITTPARPSYRSHCLNYASIRIACRN